MHDSSPTKRLQLGSSNAPDDPAKTLIRGTDGRVSGVISGYSATDPVGTATILRTRDRILETPLIRC